MVSVDSESSAEFPEEEAHALGLAWLKNDPHSRVIVNDRLEIAWCNHAADAEFKLKRDLMIRDGMLTAANRANQARLAEFVKSCDGEVRGLFFGCADGNADLIFRGQELARQGDQTFIGIRFFRSDSQNAVQHLALDQVFKLTKSEHRVLLEMLEGFTADQVAQKLGVSVETTRSHIRNIYIKLGVTSRESMFSRLHSYRL
jgi:DNA-binding CsgD family transcriptional regulator